MGQGGVPRQAEAVDTVGRCGEEEVQLEGRMGNGGKAPQLFDQRYI